MNNYISKLGLGSVQWGMDYGISNSDGLTPADEVAKIFNYAKSIAISTIDTARDYGEAEKVIGQNISADFSLCTKIPSCRNIKTSSELVSHFESSLKRSLHNLNVDKVDSLLLHDCDDLSRPHAHQLTSLLQECKHLGIVKKIGFSAYSSPQISAGIKCFKPDIVQIPFNVFDQRLLVDGTLQYLKNLNVEVHARSIFLQGLLLMDPQCLNDYFKPFMPLILRWHQLCSKLDLSPLDLSLHFAVSQPSIDKIILGISNLQQLKEVVASVRCDRSNITPLPFHELSAYSEDLVNPSRWCVEP